jgi:ABC-type multidrug transport system fused ATPase/permease subunit
MAQGKQDELEEEKEEVDDELKQEEGEMGKEGVLMMSNEVVSVKSVESEKKGDNVAASKSQEETVKVDWRSYKKFVFYTKKNYIVFPICILFFLITAAFDVLYVRFLGQYDSMKTGVGPTTFNNIHSFWLTLGLLLVGSFIFSTCKFVLVYLFVLLSNMAIHEDMIHGLVRSPSSYFDITPTGRLTNKFSNDLGIMDSMLGFVLSDSLEGPIISIILLVNIFQINVYFLIPGFINIVFVVVFYMYFKGPIIEGRQLDLRLKTPVFNMVGEMTAGLIPIRIYNRRAQLLTEFAAKIN